MLPMPPALRESMAHRRESRGVAQWYEGGWTEARPMIAPVEAYPGSAAAYARRRLSEHTTTAREILRSLRALRRQEEAGILRLAR